MSGPGREALRALLAHTLERMGRVERHALQRAAEKPNRLFAWMDDFYPAHEAKLAEALAPVFAVIGHGGAPDRAALWCAHSREDILAASEYPPAEFPARMTGVLGYWESRPAQIAQEIIP
jgi:hypothetical protein